MNQTIPASALGTVVRGSYRAHERLQEAVLALFRLARIPAVPIHTGPRVRPRPGGGFDLRKNTAQRGVSDVLGCLPPHGRLVFVECKTGGNSRRPDQVRAQQYFAGAGALCLVIRNVDELEKHLPELRARLSTSGGKTCQPTGRIQP